MPVQIEIIDLVARFNPSLLDIVTPSVTYRSRGKQPKSLTILGEEFPFIPVGLVPRATMALEDAGHDVEVIDHRRDRQRLEIVPSVWDELSTDERQFVESLQRHRTGRVLVRTDQDRCRLCAIVCRVFRDVRVLITVRTIAELRMIYRSVGFPLTYRLDRFASCYPADETGYQCAVATHKIGAFWEVKRWDFVIAPFGEQLAADTVAVDLWRTGIFRLFGFLEASKNLTGRKAMLLESLLGPDVVHEVPGLRGEPAPVAAQMIVPPSDVVIHYGDALARMRKGYWHNRARNKFIASLAAGLSTDGLPAIEEYGLPEALRDRVTALRVAIVVEAADHARSGHELLPGWIVLDNLPAGGLLPTPDVIHRVIVTYHRALQIPCLDVDVLIWACGDACQMDLPGFPPRRVEGGGLTWLIDFADLFDHLAATNTVARYEGYGAQRWQLHRPIDCSALVATHSNSATSGESK